MNRNRTYVSLTVLIYSFPGQIWVKKNAPDIKVRSRKKTTSLVRKIYDWVLLENVVDGNFGLRFMNPIQLHINPDGAMYPSHPSDGKMYRFSRYTAEGDTLPIPANREKDTVQGM